MTQREGGNIGAERAEGVHKDTDTLAILLACSTEVANPPRDRLEMLTYWQGKDESKRVAYKLRAKRLLKVWGAT